MPHVDAQPVKLPFSGRTPMARRTSLQGALICRAGSQASRMLLRYLSEGPLTDLQMASALGLPEARISARRNGLIDRGLVKWVDDVQGPWKAQNGRYGVSDKGRAIAVRLAA